MCRINPVELWQLKCIYVPLLFRAGNGSSSCECMQLCMRGAVNNCNVRISEVLENAVTPSGMHGSNKH